MDILFPESGKKESHMEKTSKSKAAVFKKRIVTAKKQGKAHQ